MRSENDKNQTLGSSSMMWRSTSTCYLETLCSNRLGRQALEVGSDSRLTCTAAGPVHGSWHLRVLLRPRDSTQMPQGHTSSHWIVLWMDPSTEPGSAHCRTRKGSDQWTQSPSVSQDTAQTREIIGHVECPSLKATPSSKHCYVHFSYEGTKIGKSDSPVTRKRLYGRAALQALAWTPQDRQAGTVPINALLLRERCMYKGIHIFII